MAIKFLSGLNLSNVTAGSLLKLDSNGNIVAATAGTDYSTSNTWSTASNSNIYYNSGGVRIGTYQASVDAAAQLHVFDYQTTSPKLLIEDGNTGDASMQFKVSTQQYTMGIDNSDSDKFIIANAGGFNLAANTHALEISTNGKITVPAHTSNGAIRLELGGYNRLRFNGGVDLLGYTSDHLWVIGNSTTNTINLGADWDWDKQVAISYTPNTVGNAGGVMILGQTEKNNANWTHGTTKLYTNGTERLRIDSNGNVGIGTTAAGARLTLNGDGHTDNYQGVLRIFNTDSSTWSHIAFPDTLSGNSNANNYYLIGRGSALSGRVMSFHIPRDNDYGDSIQPKFGFYSTGADLLHSIEAETGNSYFKGRLGIGDSSPHAELVVNGKIDTSDTDNGAFRIYDGSTFRGGWGTANWTGSNFGNSSSDLVAYVNGSNKYFIGTNSQPRITVDGTGNIRFNAYTAGLLKTDSNGNVSLDTSTYLTTSSAAETYATTDHGHTDATQEASGFMSSTDKIKLDGMTDGAQPNVQADWNATTGDAFIQNKPTLFDGAYSSLSGIPSSFTPSTHNHDGRYYTETEADDRFIQNGNSLVPINASDSNYQMFADEVVLSTNNLYRGLAFPNKGKNFVFEVSIKGNGSANHQGIFWGLDTLSSIYGNNEAGYKLTHQSESAFHIRDIANNSNQLTHTTLGYAPNDNQYHRYKIISYVDSSESSNALFKVYVDGVEIFSAPQFAAPPQQPTYFGFINYTGDVTFSNWNVREITGDKELAILYGDGVFQPAGTYLTSLPAHNHDARYYTETEMDTFLGGKLSTSGGTISKTTNTTGTSGTTFLEIANNVGGDISQQQSFIDFKFTDTNANWTPQVRIGAQVGRDADANAISKEGAGAFVVYTGNGTDESGGGILTEAMRVSYNGKLTVGGDIYSGTSKIATESFATGEASGVQDNLDSLSGSLGNAAFTSASDYAPASHTHSQYLRNDTSDSMSGNLTISGTTPLRFSSIGTGTYNQTYLYHSANGVVLELAKKTDVITGDITNFAIGTRGGGYNPFTITGSTGDVSMGYNLSVTGNVTGANLNISNWDTAYGWGNHASAGYLTSLPSHNHDSDYINVGGDTMTGILKLNKGVTNSNWSTFTHLEGANSLNNPSGTGGAIRIELPTSEYNTNTMMSMTVKVYEYSTGKSFTLFLGGYNYTNQNWYNTFATLVGDNERGDVPVYFGNNGTDRNVIWIGNPDWSWSYPNVWVTDFQSGHSQGQDWNDGWRIVFDENTRTNVTASRTARKQITTGNISGYGYLTSSSASSTYVPLSGGTMTGSLQFSTNGNNIIIPHSGNNTGNIVFSQDNSTYHSIDFSAYQGMIGFYNLQTGATGWRWRFGVNGTNQDKLWHAGFNGYLIDANGDYNGTWQGYSPSSFASASGNATQAWVQSQGYITSETDSQTLTFNSSNGELTISNGNTVDLDSRYLDATSRKTWFGINASAAQAKRYRIGRVYYCPAHWDDTWQNIKFKLTEESYSGAFVEYSLFGYYNGSQNQTLDLRVTDFRGLPSDTRRYSLELGQHRDAGWEHSGQPVYYTDIFVDVSYYKALKVMADTLGHSWQSTDPTSGAAITVFYSTPEVADITYTNVDKVNTYLGLDTLVWNTNNFSSTDVNNWNTAYGWGNHASAGYITSFDITTQTDSKYLRSDVADVYDGRTLSFGTAGNGSNTSGCFLSIEGNTDSSGEGSGRFMFREHNSSTAAMDKYGMSIGYRGGGTSITTAGGNTWTGLSQIGNGQWGMWGHNNDATGALIMYGDRAATYVNFAGNDVQGVNDLYVADQIIHTGDTNTYMQFHAADQWRVVTGGSERLQVSNSDVLVQNDFKVAGSYTEVGNSIGSVSNDGGWNARLNVAGSSHARLDVKSVSDGIITTMYAHTGHNQGKVGTISSHSLGLMTGGTQRVIVDTNGHMTPNVDRTQFLGSDTNRWQIVFCETLDSAGQHESNLQDEENPISQYETGTVLSWKDGKNRPCTQYADHMRMGIAVHGQDSPLIQGAEPVLCTGVVEEGDYLVTSDKEGHAVAVPRNIVKEQMLFDCVIGKALENGDGESHLVKTWINI